MRSTIRQTGRVAVVATAACLGLGVLAGPAFAAGAESDLKLSLSEPAAVAPGEIVEVPFALENVGDQVTEGVQLNMSLPPGVGVGPASSNCEETGENNEGGILVSCSISGPEGELDPGEKLESTVPFEVLPDAPVDTDLGNIGALVTPLQGGVAPVEDLGNLGGTNAAETALSTVSGANPAGGWMSTFTGLFS